MNKTFKTILSLVFFTAIFSSSFSQEGTYVEVRDFETWASAGLRLKLNKKWELTLTEQYRLKTNSSVTDQFFTQVEANYIGLDNLELGGGFRFIRENDNVGNIQGYESHTRFNLDLAYKHDISRFKMSYRLRYQSKNEIGVSKEEGDYANQHLRLKLGTTYKIKNWKLDPKVSVEIFRYFEKEQQNEFDKFRMTVGTDYEFKKIGTFSAFYRMELELNATYPKTTNILGLKYLYTFKINNK